MKLSVCMSVCLYVLKYLEKYCSYSVNGCVEDAVAISTNDATTAENDTSTA